MDQATKTATGKANSTIQPFCSHPCVQLGMEGSMEEYKQWCGKEVDKYLLADYQKARQRLKKREPLETSLANTEGAEQLDKFLQYVALEKEEGEPARVQCLYERAVAEHCLVDVLWEEYLAYMESTFKVGWR